MALLVRASPSGLCHTDRQRFETCPTNPLHFYQYHLPDIKLFTMSWLESRGQWFLEDKKLNKNIVNQHKKKIKIKIQNNLKSSQNQTNQERKRNSQKWRGRNHIEPHDGYKAKVLNLPLPPPENTSGPRNLGPPLNFKGGCDSKRKGT